MNVFQKLIVYYFSGTGNSRNVAWWMTNIAKESGMKTQLKAISGACAK